MNHRRSVKILLKTVLIVLSSFLININVYSQDNIQNEVNSYLKNLPFDMPAITVPHFPDRVFNIINYGAVGDGYTLNTKSINEAITDCSDKGGGKVIVPPGLWLTGPIELKSNVNLHLEKGALLMLSKNHADYPMLKFPGSGKVTAASPVYGYKLNNVAITGEGIIDGSGETWRPVKKSKTTASQWKSITASGGSISEDGRMWWPSKEAMKGENYLKNLFKEKKRPSTEDFLPVKDYLRPYMILLVKCKNVLFEGPTFENSPKFIMYPNRCENLILRNLKILNEWWAQNGDGIDISACKNVLVYKCVISVGDDGICMKSSKSTKNGSEAALQNIVIADNVVYHAHGGFVIGSNTDGGMKNISVKNCDFIGTDIGLRFKSVRAKGGLVEDIYVDSVFMKDIANQAILFNTYYEVSRMRQEEQKFAVNEKTPRFRNFYITNIVCNGAKNAIEITGLPEMPIKDISLKNITISATRGFSSENAENINLNNVKIIPGKGPVYTLENSKDITLDSIYCPGGTNTFMKLNGNKNQNILVKHSVISGAKTPVEYANGASSNSVIIK